MAVVILEDEHTNSSHVARDSEQSGRQRMCLDAQVAETDRECVRVDPLFEWRTRRKIIMRANNHIMSANTEITHNCDVNI